MARRLFRPYVSLNIKHPSGGSKNLEEKAVRGMKEEESIHESSARRRSSAGFRKGNMKVREEGER
jgi:hypothetical protein